MNPVLIGVLVVLLVAVFFLNQASKPKK